MRGIFLSRIFSGMMILFAGSAAAQYYHTPFGQNRIQYKRFDWYYYSTNNFEVYYYPGGQEYAREALTFLEDEFVKLTDILGYAPYTKTKILIYNSIQDLQQSNVGIGGDVFTIGGKTDFVKLQVEIAHPGKAGEFKKKLIEELSRILINDMMFGGSLAEIFQNAYLLSLPDWFIDGAANYLAYGWSAEMDDYVRDYLGRRKITKLVKIQNEDARIVGQSIWNFIAIKYGRSNISNILNLTRIIRNEENSIASTLGISFKEFLSQWQNYYLLQKEEIETNYQSPVQENMVAAYRNSEVAISHVKVSPDGNKVAYTYHKNGKYEVHVVDAKSGRGKKIISGGYHINGQEVDYQLPLIDWQDNDHLGVLLYKRGYLYLNTYNIHRNEGKFQKPLTRFRQVESFSFNDNGRLAVISGDIDGKNDLFLVSMRRNALRRITNDHYDDQDPVFIPGTAAIVFSSNRVGDSVKTSDITLKEVGENFNLFVYDLDTTTHKFYRLTNTYSIDRKPLAKNPYSIFYLSDQKGITNLYQYSLLDSTFVQVSAYRYGIQDYDIAFDDNTFSYIMLSNGRDKVFVEDAYDLDHTIFTPQTGRRRLQQARYVISRMPSLTKKTKVEEEEKEQVKVPDSLVTDTYILPDSFSFEDEVEQDTAVIQEPDEQKPDTYEEQPDNEGLIDTDNYVFEDDIKSAYRPESFFSSYRKLERKSRVTGPSAYNPKFSFSNLITSFAIDPLRGFSILMETQISDMLENHRLIGGVLTPTDFRSGSLFAEYQFLKYWMDFHVRFDRRSYLFHQDFEEELTQKYVFNKIEVGAALPLTNTVRFELSPFFAYTEFRNLHSQAIARKPPNANLAPDSWVNYMGFRSALVIDNTIEKGFNIYQGTRGLIEFKTFGDISNKDKSFSKLRIDLRHYQKIHKELTLAGKVFYGRSIGKNKQMFLVGGMDNWIFNETEDQGVGDPLALSNTKDNSNILFTEFVTNLRGFDYNEIYGANALIFNAELRFPVFRYFSSGPIASNFLRNFQLIGFYDVGTAWSGKPPFSRNASAITKKYNSGSGTFIAEIANFRNPWLAGYGFGVRTFLLGYYLKVDVARPIQDFEIGSTRFYFTLGLDF